jgi:hypothetical protein
MVRVRHEWLRRVEAEYRSSVITQTLTLWMTQVAVSPDLIAEGLRIAQDELDHAAISWEVYLAAGGTETPTVERESLTFGRTEGLSLEDEIVRMGLDSFCLGETVAVPLFRSLREGCTEPVAREALDRILKDEVRHRDFGWALLAWMLEVEPRRKSFVERLLPNSFRGIRASYAPAYSGHREKLPEAAIRWGLMDTTAYAEAVQKTWERDWQPRFAKLEIDASAAWAAALSAPPR